MGLAITGVCIECGCGVVQSGTVLMVSGPLHHDDHEDVSSRPLWGGEVRPDFFFLLLSSSPPPPSFVWCVCAFDFSLWRRT